MPFVNVNVDSYLPCGSRLKNEVLYQFARFPVFVLGVYFHFLLLKFGVLAEHC